MLKIYKTVARAVRLNGAGTWALMKKDENENENALTDSENFTKRATRERRR